MLTNGSFEPDVATGGYGLFPCIPGWALFSGPSIEIQDNVAGTPFDGDLIFQLVDTTPATCTACSLLTRLVRAY